MATLAAATGIFINGFEINFWSYIFAIDFLVFIKLSSFLIGFGQVMLVNLLS